MKPSFCESRWAVLAVSLFAAGCNSPTSHPEPLGTVSSPLISGLFDTGVDGTGAVLPAGSVDPHYVMTSNDPAFPGPNAYVATPANGWAANTATSQWITIQPTGNAGTAQKVYSYTTTFTLTGVNPATVTLSGTWACEHSCVVKLNGTQMASKTTPGWGSLDPFTIPAGSPFVIGINTLAFTVNNTSGGPTGLHVSGLTTTGTGSGCTADSQCSTTEFCNTQSGTCSAKLSNGTTIPTVSGHTPPLNGMCTMAAGASVCASGVCDTTDNKCGFANGEGPCTMANGATVCRSSICGANGTCVSSTACNKDSDCGAGEWCNETSHMCSSTLPNGTLVPTDPAHNNPMLNGTCTPGAGQLVCQSGVCDTGNNECGFANGDGACSNGTVCQSGACDSDMKCGYANGDGPCSPGAAAVCRSGLCSTNMLCEPAGGCNVDADCPTGNWCNEMAHTCNSQLPNGSAIPIDGAHSNPTLNGTCTTAAAMLVCESGICDPTTNQCGIADGNGPCTTNAQCISNNCPAGTCVGATCNLDTDCPVGDWCNETSHVCVTRLANGQPIPTDSAHMNPTLDGTCTTAAGADVCLSGVCDPTDNKCGYANGDGTCTPVTSAVCRSGVCATTGPNAGKCVACLTDSNCPTASPHCDPTTNSCTGCVTDSECGSTMSGLVCDTNAHDCVSGCRGTGGNGCPFGDHCTSIDNTIGQCVLNTTSSTSTTSSSTGSASTTSTGTGSTTSTSAGGTSTASGTASTGTSMSTSGAGGSAGTGGSSGVFAQGHGIFGCSVSTRGEGESNEAPAFMAAAAALWLAKGRRRRR